MFPSFFSFALDSPEVKVCLSRQSGWNAWWDSWYQFVSSSLIFSMVSSVSSFSMDTFRINTATCGLGNNLPKATNFQLNDVTGWTNMNIHIWQYYNFICTIFAQSDAGGYYLFHAILCGFYSRAATNRQWCLLNSSKKNGLQVFKFMAIGHQPPPPL